MPRKKTNEILHALIQPIQRNDLEERRRALDLSRVDLARILDVDPSTVFRCERGKMSPLWDYAMRGIEAEAKAIKPIVREVERERAEKADFMDARGFPVAGHKIRTARAKPAARRLRRLQLHNDNSPT